MIAETLPGPGAIQWRYDPIIIAPDYDCDWHRENFAMIAGQLQGMTRVVNVSFVEPYLKALSKAVDWQTISWRQPDPERHKAALKKYQGIKTIGMDGVRLLNNLKEIASRNGMELRVCCNREYGDRFPSAACCSAEMFTAYGEELGKRIATLSQGPSRPGCQCLKTVDIGMDTTCPGGCFYCYVTTSLERARLNYERHNPAATMLRNT